MITRRGAYVGGYIYPKLSGRLKNEASRRGRNVTQQLNVIIGYYFDQMDKGKLNPASIRDRDEETNITQLDRNQDSSLQSDTLPSAS